MKKTIWRAMNGSLTRYGVVVLWCLMLPPRVLLARVFSLSNFSQQHQPYFCPFAFLQSVFLPLWAAAAHLWDMRFFAFRLDTFGFAKVTEQDCSMADVIRNIQRFSKVVVHMRYTRIKLPPTSGLNARDQNHDHTGTGQGDHEPDTYP